MGDLLRGSLLAAGRRRAPGRLLLKSLEVSVGEEVKVVPVLVYIFHGGATTTITRTRTPITGTGAIARSPGYCN